ncbi:MAG: hypothetical protein K8T91_09945 [Planctomycetes bacterium]|nr:hypothetical protein [Planctomycetota bacterium]
MVRTAQNHVAQFTGTSNQTVNALAVRRSDSGVHRLPQIRTDWVATNVETADSGRSELGTLAAEVANAVQNATLQHRENNSWVQLELDLWKAVTSTVEKWRRQAPAPAMVQQRTAASDSSSRRVVGPVRFQLRHR